MLSVVTNYLKALSIGTKRGPNIMGLKEVIKLKKIAQDLTNTA